MDTSYVCVPSLLGCQLHLAEADVAAATAFGERDLYTPITNEHLILQSSN